MKHFNLFLIVFLIFAFGCVKDNPVQLPEDTLDSPLLKSSEKVTRTFRLFNATGSWEFVFDAEECDGLPQQLITGTGNATHIGQFTVKNTYCFYMVGDNMIIVGDWLGFMTAANGDVIHTQVLNPSEDYLPGLLPGDESYVKYEIIGGTGRYKCAKGNFYMSGSIFPDDIYNPIYGTWILSGEGTICY